MPKQFRLVKEYFSEKEQEWQWTYQLLTPFSFNEKIITQVTITDHIWKKKSREMITKDLLLFLLSQVDGQILEPLEYQGSRKPFAWETIHEGKSYILFFWFDDYNSNGLWIRNCHRVD